MPETLNETVVVTGASAGVGRATVRTFAERGARIGLLARGTEGLEGAKHDVERLGGEALAVPTDVANADEVEDAAAQVEDAFGEIDVWVNDAMTGVFAEFTDIESEEYERVTDVCYHGQVHGTRTALRRMMPRDRGSIVLVGSALAYRGIPLQSAYCGAKHAVEGMFDSLRAELLHNDSNVQVTMVQLPGMNTPQFGWVRSKLPKKAQPVPPIYQPEVAAEAIVWAAHHDRREVYVGSSSMQVIVGNKLFPGLADRYLARTAYGGQQTGDPKPEDRPDNLFEPVEGDRGARGDFDEQARSWSPQLWLDKNKRWLMIGGAVLAGALGVALVDRE